MKRFIRLATLVLILFSCGRPAFSQGFQGGVRGSVMDPGGAIIPGVEVQLINVDNNATRMSVTNEQGQYNFSAVNPGNYKLKAGLPGFKTFERQGLTIGTQEFPIIDIKMEVGSVSEEVQVVAESPILETSNASTGAVLDSVSLEALPSAGRSIFLMANLQPTVQTSANAHWNRMQDQVGNSAVSMGGGAVRANNFVVDGFPVTDLQNRASTNPTIEAVGEMKVQVHTYDAESGRTGGGVMNMTAKSGVNAFHGTGYMVFRPESMVSELLIPKLQGMPNRAEYWRDGGGGGGGPIVKDKTFFWVAGEKYVDNQPQQSTYLVPTAAELKGDFSAVTRNGAPITLKNPLTGQPFPGNIINVPLNPIGAKLASYLPAANTQVDTGASNFGYTDLLPNHASQITTKIDQHFNDRIALSGFWLRQVTHEANSNFNPVNDFAGQSYQLDRVISTVVLNNTYTLNNSTVLTIRGGYNHFDDNYNLNDRNGKPLNFNVSALGWPTSLTSQMSDLQRFPSLSVTGYMGTGWTNRQANGYYQYGINGTLSKLSGSHNYKAGADYRIIGANSLNYGASTGTYSFTGTFSGNALADLLLGYPASGSVPLNVTMDGFVRYYAGFVQDDWRVNHRLTVNYGLRLERETGMMERNNQITVNFDQTAVNPLDKLVNVLDPVTGTRRQLLGGLVFAGVNGAPKVQGNQPSIKAAPRAGLAFNVNDKTVLRGGWGLYYSPWNYPAAGTTGWGQTGFSATTNIQQTSGTPTISLSNPFPAGLVQPSGNSLGLLTGVGGDVYFIDPHKGAPRVQQYSVDLQRELGDGINVSVGYTGLTGTNISWGGSGNALININQIDPKYQSLPASYTGTPVANPFQGVAAAGQFAGPTTIAQGQLMRPFPEFGNVYMQQSTGAHSRYSALIMELRKRSTGLWGGSFSYTYSRLNDNQFGESNYYSSNPGLQNNYTVIPGSPYYNPNLEYGRSLLDSPHKLVVAPTVNLPFGQGRQFLSGNWFGDRVLGGWAVTPVFTLQSGFPIGVTQNVTTTNTFLFGDKPRPNIVSGQPFLMPGNITDRIKATVTPTKPAGDNLYLNQAAFSPAAANQFGNAPRMLPGVLSPWRDNFDLGISKQIKTSERTSAVLRIEALNLFNIVQWAAPASASFGNSSFGQITTQANNMRMVQFTLRFQF
jgi:hypothetical protein